MFDENWRSIIGYPQYWVSDKGRVMNARRAHVLRDITGRDPNYDAVTLYKNGQKRYFNVHNLVTGSFLGPCPEGYEVDHKDRNGHNNCLSNLRYVDKSKNARNKSLSRQNKSGLRGVHKDRNRWRPKLTHKGKTVMQCYCNSKREAARMYINALAEIDEEDAANAQAEYDAYESDDERTMRGGHPTESEDEDICGAM